ncbi:MAG: hypothetical protein Q8N26_20725, partial [Myxococcales bacterium]|nr:hypothetical protein [Myxococcales bacterium]
MTYKVMGDARSADTVRAMVRREGKAEEIAEATAEAEPCCASPAGESPARVIAGEPGSRPAPE